MARRMFSDEITNSDAFLDMPADSQNLYFHIGMGADDDGFISNTKMIQRAINSSDDALKILFGKKFLIQFSNGICVVKHWRINNYIRKDIYSETKYTKEKSSLFIRKNGAYTLNPKDAIPVPRGHFTIEKIEENNPSTLRLRDVDIGKVRIGKVSKDIDLPIWLNKKAWDEWIQFRIEKNRGKKLPPTTIKKHLKILGENIKDHVQIIEKSIMCNWTGLFPLKDNQQKNRSIPIRKYEEPDDSKELSDRRKILNEQSKTLVDKMKVN